MNLLLAIFYSNFKQRFEQNLEKQDGDRSDYLYNQFKRFGGTKGYLDQKETYRMFMMIHGLVTNTNQDIDDEELEAHDSAMRSTQLENGKNKKRDISLKQFDYIYKNKILNNLEEKGRFKFTEMNVLLNAYEYWKYENINK